MTASLKKPLTPPTLALRWVMNREQVAEISARARDLKESSRETNRSIADYCDVTERSVAGWLSPTAPKPMTYENAEKLADLFQVDTDWLWRGREKGATPDVLAALEEAEFAERLSRLEDKMDQILKRLTGEKAETPA
jgi:transcriptional regulator with XRE-family HTH domain